MKIFGLLNSSLAQHESCFKCLASCFCLCIVFPVTGEHRQGTRAEASAWLSLIAERYGPHHPGKDFPRHTERGNSLHSLQERENSWAAREPARAAVPKHGEDSALQDCAGIQLPPPETSTPTKLPSYGEKNKGGSWAAWDWGTNRSPQCVFYEELNSGPLDSHPCCILPHRLGFTVGQSVTRCRAYVYKCCLGWLGGPAISMTGCCGLSGLSERTYIAALANFMST